MRNAESVLAKSCTAQYPYRAIPFPGSSLCCGKVHVWLAAVALWLWPPLKLDHLMPSADNSVLGGKDWHDLTSGLVEGQPYDVAASDVVVLDLGARSVLWLFAGIFPRSPAGHPDSSLRTWL